MEDWLSPVSAGSSNRHSSFWKSSFGYLTARMCSLRVPKSTSEKERDVSLARVMHDKIFMCSASPTGVYLRPPPDLLSTVFQFKLLNQSLAYCPRPQTPYFSPRYECPNKFKTARGNGRGLDIPAAVGLKDFLALLASPRPETSFEVSPDGAAEASGI